jgi:hypothetical protein
VETTVKRVRISLVLLLLGAAPWPCQVAAGPPYTTDDPEPVELHHWEVYLGSQVATRPGAGASGTGPHLEVNYGVAPECQLHLIAPLAWARSPGGPTELGYGDTEVGVKFRFIREGEWTPQVGTFVMLELPTGSAARGLGAGHAQVFLPLWIQKSFGPWSTYAGGGYGINRGTGSRDWWYLGWQAQRTLAEGVALGAEVYRRTAQQAGAPAETRFNLGLVLDFGELHHLLVSGGTGLGSGGVQAYLAYQLTLAPAAP